MSLQVNGNPTVNWESLLQQVGTLTKATAAGDKPVLTFNTTAADGTQSTITVNIPDDLELPGTVDQAAIDSLCAKLAADPGFGLDAKQIEAFRTALTDALKAAGVSDSISALSTSKNIMFDLYKLMALLVEVAQKQRDSARDLRTAQSQQIQTSILNQAEQQRRIAWVGIVGSIACCAVQVGAMAYSLGKQASAFKTQMASLETSGVGSARQNQIMLKAGESAQGAQQQLASARANIDDATAQRIQDSFDSATIAKGKMQAHEILLGQDTAKLQRLQNLNAPLQEADIPQGQQGDALRTAQTRLNEFREMQQLQNGPKPLNEGPANRLTTLENKFKNVTEQQVTEEFNTARTNAANQFQQTVQDDTAKVNTFKAQANNQLDATVKTYEDAYDTAVRERAAVGPDATKAEIKALDERLETAGKELRFARAHAINERIDTTTAAERQALTSRADTRWLDAQARLKGDTSYLKAGNVIQRHEAYHTVINALGNAMQGVIQGATSMMQAKVTEQNAYQTQMEQELEQAKDLFNQAGDLVQSVLQLMHAVSSAETQSMRDAIQV